MAMTVGVCRIQLRMAENETLKGKRQVLHSIISRIRNKFNVSIAEVGDNDLWQSATIGVAFVSNDSRYTNEVLSKVVDTIGNSHFDAELVDYNIELLPLG